MDALHHANIVLGKGDCKAFVFGILDKKLNFSIHKNPDFLFFSSESFGILDARNLEKWVMGKPLMGDTKVSLIVVNSITSEAQNALLKVLEEPPLGTYIFINIENLGSILPTLLSRVRVLNVAHDDFSQNTEAEDAAKTASKFLKSGIKERFSMIRSFSRDEGKADMKSLIKNLEGVAYKEVSTSKNMKNILLAKVFISARGSSPKMLLEWLAGVL